MKTYKASKTQILKLIELNVSETPRDYNHAAELLDNAGWDRSGTVQICFDAKTEDARVNDQEFDR